MLKQLRLILIGVLFIPTYNYAIEQSEVDRLYPMALESAGGLSDTYTADQINAFNSAFLPLLGLDKIPEGANMILPSTPKKYIVRMLEAWFTQTLHSEVMQEVECDRDAEASTLSLDSLEDVEQIKQRVDPIVLSQEEQVQVEVEILGDIYSDPIDTAQALEGRVRRISEDEAEIRFASGNDQYIEDFVIKGEGMMAAYSNKYVDCEECPEYVAAVQLIEPIEKFVTQSQQCSGSLVEFGGKTLFVTNRHCIPEDMKKAFRNGEPIENCSARIVASFPALNNGDVKKDRQIAHCEKILAISTDGVMGEGPPDWAVIEMSDVDRKPAPMIGRDLIEGESIELHPMFYHERNGELREVELRTDSDGQQRDYAIVEVEKRRCKQMSATSVIGSRQCDAELTSGNSGSGAFNQNGQFTGVLSHIVPVGMTNDEYMRMRLNNEVLWSPAFLGTSSRDILRDIYLRSLDDPAFRPVNIDSLRELFPGLSEAKSKIQ